MCDTGHLTTMKRQKSYLVLDTGYLAKVSCIEIQVDPSAVSSSFLDFIEIWDQKFLLSMAKQH